MLTRDPIRDVDKRIYKTEMKFWVVFGGQGCREKKLTAAISMKLFLGKKEKTYFENILASALKS